MRTRLRFRKRSRAFSLDATSIDNASSWLVESLAEGGADKSDCLRMRLLFEETLINFAGRLGKESEAVAQLSRRQGRFRLRLTVEGARYNPLRSESDAWGDMSASLFSVIDMHTQYSYSMGSNIVRLSMPKTPLNPVLKIGIAILIGAIIGAIGNVLIPDASQEAFCGAVLTPISDMWVRLLQAISGPIIFLTALTATFGTKRIVDFGGSGIFTIVRYFAFSAVIVLFTLICMMPFVFTDITITEIGSSILSGALNEILKVVPENLIAPFSTANTPQLLLIAIVTGYLLAFMDSRVDELKIIIDQLNALGMAVARQACALVPFFVGLLLCLKIWTHDIELLGNIWFPLVLSTAISIAMLIVAVLIIAVRYRMSPFLLAKKLKQPFIDALKRGTLDFATVDDLAGSCERDLGIDFEFARATLPQGLFLYMPTSAIGICVFVFFAAQTQGIVIDQTWIAAAAALSVILAVATPPVTGANLLSFVMAFTYLGISSNAMLDVMIFDIVFSVLCIAFDQAMLQLETIRQSESMGFLDEAALRSPMTNV